MNSDDADLCLKCGHRRDDHEAIQDSDGYPHDVEQFCMGGDELDCECTHFEEPDAV